MGYAKVRRIEITDNKVFLTSAENNIRPLYYRREEYSYLSGLLATKGRKAVDMELLFSFFCGDLQGKNKYSAAIERAENAGAINDHHNQYLKCVDDKAYREQFLNTLFSYLSHRTVAVMPPIIKDEYTMQQQLF